MRRVAEPIGSLRWFRLAVLATVSVAVANCSGETSRFDSNPYRAKSAQGPSHEVTGSVHTRTPPVQSQPLPPPSAAAPATRPTTVGSTYQSPSREVASRSGRWIGEGGTAITVQQGDTIDGLVRTYGVSASAIAEANNLPNGAALKPGQRLIIPKHEITGSTPAPKPVAAATPQRMAPAPLPARTASTAAAGAQHVHVIAPGETLMKLSRQYNKPLVEIAKANNIPPHTMVKIGDRIVIPGARPRHAEAPKPAAPQQVAAPAPALAAPKLAEKPAKPAAEPQQKVATIPATTTANVVSPVAQNPAPEKAKPDTTGAMPSFRWPVRGRVVAGFGPKPTGGQQNDGINISVPEGTPVKASEDGVVAYAGNELKSYGNLVLVRHSNGYVTAYAHASEILVKRDEPVKRGQVIAKSGQTGTVAAPQLHFEIRKGSTPVDPAPLLDKGGG
jgi:murein DD-endopeptidase MepM/ murein hydrolase activator NlpD